MDDIAAAAKAPFAATALAPPTVEAEATGDGGWLLRQPVPLGAVPDHLIGVLRDRAAGAPERIFLAERDGAGGWRTLDYRTAAAKSAAIGQALIDRGHGPDRPVAILSDNSIDFGLLQLGCMHVSVPVMPVSPAYSLMSRDFAKLKGVIAHHDPSAVFVDDPGPFAAALEALDLDGRMLLTSDGADGTESLAEWAETPATDALEARLAGVGPDTVAKILLTSGSTGLPKGVINTQRMLCANQVQTIHAYPFLLERPPVICDWLPWNHTFGGNFCFNMTLFHGGTFWLDEGKPAPGLFEKTLANLRQVKPTLYLNVPRGYDVLVRALEADAGLRDRLLGDLDVLFFAGAALPQSLREKLDALSVAARGARTPIVTSLGSTETAPAGTYMTWDSDAWGNIGVPLPGVEMKLAPNGDKLEARFRGPTVSPGYWGSPDLTAKAFDADGYFRIGDAVKFLDPGDPAQGLVFDGRVTENFKLLSGTWVAVGTLRLAVISAAAPVLQDAAITGHDRDEIGLIGFPSLPGCRALCPDLADDATLADVIARPEIRERLRAGLAQHNAENRGSSTRIARALLTAEPPAIDAGEITDKGYINQRAVLARRAAEVDRLHADPPDPDLIDLTGRPT
ncbi:MAG: feruloyl-CoA synthase [Defluviicoccus sp.]|nr:feruloyl-CoA synthase [Defluviicoccus sp.]MDE0278775.1 feruloyl-CoA synthase [Defluviicoccus sp.]